MSTEETRVQPRQDGTGGSGNGPAAAPAEPPRDAMAPGSLLVNTYRIERLLGGGGMGEVYLARHTGLGTQHAIKVIRPSMAADRQVMDLFYREARVLRGVRNDAVVSYDGFVRDEEGRDYLVMEYAEGPPLSEHLRHGRLTPKEVLALRDRLAAGLAEAHAKGAVHRDLSPDNVILPDGRIDEAKLIDFGLCKLTDPSQQTILGGTFAGKFRYASPEQFGLYGGVVDARSDIYSLGLVLAAAARGQPLDMGTNFGDALEARKSVPELGGVPTELRSWLAAMLQPDPARRPASMDEVLRRWPSPSSGPRPAPSHPGPGPHGGGGWSRWLIWGLMPVLLVAIGLAIWWWWPGETVPDGSNPPPVEPKPPPVEPTPPPPTPTPPVESGPPTGSAPDLMELLRAGRLEDAFTLARERIAAGDAPPADQTWALALALRDAGQLDPAFYLTRELANGGLGPAAFTLANWYDPLHWSEQSSPFTGPNARKAAHWYRQAEAAGVHEAGARLQALERAGESP